jgi:hypothetical protein
MQDFIDQVKNYTPEQRRAWLDRLNQQQRDYYNSLDAQGRAYYEQNQATPGPIVYQEDFLNLPFSVQREALIIEGNLQPEAREAAEKKAEQALRAEVHEIMSGDTDATAINIEFNSANLNDEDKARYRAALAAIALPITEGAPLDFKARNAVEPFMNAMAKMQKSFLLDPDVTELAKTAGIDEDTARHLASAYNSRQMALSRPLFLADRLLRYPGDIYTETFVMDGEKVNAPMNLEYAEKFMREAHILAVKQSINSATLDRNITSVSFFDLEKIGTREQLASQQLSMLDKIGGLIGKAPDLPKPESAEDGRELLEILNDAHAKPEQIMEAAKKIGGYKEIFDANAGNWEGFTLGEHTETVIRNFDENFADILPVDFLPLMRLTLLVHDIGKSQAVAAGEKGKQKGYNAYYATDFLNRIGVEAKTKDLILSIIGNGSTLAFNSRMRPMDASTYEDFSGFSKQNIRKYLGTEEATDAEAKTFMELCDILQICDGGAYTSMAITRKEGKGRHRNAPSFNESFSTPNALGKRDIKYKQLE